MGPKTLLVLIVSCVAMRATAQNYAVKFYGANPDGVATNFPVEVLLIGTNNATPPGFNIVTNFAGVQALRQAGQASFNAFIASQQATAESTRTANIAALVALFGRVDNGLILTTNLFTAITNVENSLASGTNTQAQVVLRIRQLNGVVNDQNRIVQGVLELLQRLFPPLKEIYQTSQGQ